MTHKHHGRACHLNGCDTDQTVPVECPACEQVIGHASKGGMAQSSATWDKLNAHSSDCRGETMTQTVGTIGEPWRSWLGTWRNELDPDLPVVFYEDDGTDTPDAWASGPHLAIRTDWVVDGERRGLVWPARVDGWADPTAIGWDGVIGLIGSGRRQISGEDQ